jgi:hypothetical protein
MRDHLTKVSATEYDPNLVDADTRLRNDEHKFWFLRPSRSIRDAVKALATLPHRAAANPPTSKPLTGRNVELIRLFQAWSRLAGDAHANLLRENASFFETDDYFLPRAGLRARDAAPDVRDPPRVRAVPRRARRGAEMMDHIGRRSARPRR